MSSRHTVVLAVEEVGVLALKQHVQEWRWPACSPAGFAVPTPSCLGDALSPSFGLRDKSPPNQPHRSVGLELRDLGPERTPVPRCPPTQSRDPPDPSLPLPGVTSAGRLGVTPPSSGWRAPPAPPPWNLTTSRRGCHPALPAGRWHKARWQCGPEPSAAV